MAEESKEVRRDAALEAALHVKLAPHEATAAQPTREAMSWIRALANDWEDAMSQSQAPK